MITVVLLGYAAVVFICLDYIIPAIVVGVIIPVQPIALMITSSMIEKIFKLRFKS